MPFNDFTSSVHSIQMLGTINALKTGDPTLDTMLAIFIPFFLSQLWSYRELIISLFSSHLFPIRKSYSRTISYRSTKDPDQAMANLLDDENSYNLFLLKAIKLYVHECCNLVLTDADLELTPMSTMSTKKLSQNQNRGHPWCNKGNNSINGASKSKILQGCTIIKNPVNNKWHTIGTYNGCLVYMKCQESFSNGNGGTKTKNTSNSTTAQETTDGLIQIKFKSDGLESIDTFVNTAFKWYKAYLQKMDKNERFLFDLRGFDGRTHHKYPSYSKFKLHDEKTFDSLFSQQCHSLLKIVDQFQNKSGKYAVKGYPHKLGILLHGPPGTGKTTFIKALSKYTNRNIVNIPLSRINTNQELMTLFTFNKFTSNSNSETTNLRYKDLIYVLEDVDATSKIVMSRDMHCPERDNPSYNNNNNKLVEEKKQDTEVVGLSRPSFGSNVMKADMKRTMVEDELNLTGLLNALDGVVDTPGRIVIMTTNYPNLLDPALIRPGRIDKILELGHMVDLDVIAMLEHYYQTKLSESYIQRIKSFVPSSSSNSSSSSNNKEHIQNGKVKLIPAEVELLAMEKENVEDMIQCLEMKASCEETKIQW